MKVVSLLAKLAFMVATLWGWQHCQPFFNNYANHAGLDEWMVEAITKTVIMSCWLLILWSEIKYVSGLTNRYHHLGSFNEKGAD